MKNFRTMSQSSYDIVARLHQTAPIDLWHSVDKQLVRTLPHATSDWLSENDRTCEDIPCDIHLIP